MSVKYTSNSAKVLNETQQKYSVALRLMLSAIEQESKSRTPKNTGDLRNQINKQVLNLNGKIVWNMDYAVFQETKQFTNYTTAGTGPHFAEDGVKKVVDDADRYFSQAGVGK